MKNFFLFTILTFILGSCVKKNATLETISDKFAGKWFIVEFAESRSSGGYNSVFYSTIFKVNDSTFGLIESNRTPIPTWIYWPNIYDYRTIYFQANEQTKTLYSTNPVCGGKYSLNMDTIDFSFQSFGMQDYDVRQRLIRQ